MKISFRDKFIAIVSATAVILTVASAPARADDDFLKTVAVIAGAAIVGKVIYDQTLSQRQRTMAPRYEAPRATPQRTPQRNAPVLVSTSLRPVARPVAAQPTNGAPVYDRSPLDGIATAPLTESLALRQPSLLPGDCLRSADSGDDSIQFFSTECLTRQSVDVSTLPLECARKIGSRRAAQTGFEARCLSQSGYRLSPT